MKSRLVIFLLLMGMGGQLWAKTVLFLGDSLTAGYGVAQEKSYPQLLLNKLRQEGLAELKLINGSIDGSTSADGLQRLGRYLKAKPEVLVLSLGANDGLRGIDLASTKENLKNIIEQALQRQMKVVLLGVRLPPNYGQSYRQEFEQIYRSLAGEYRVEFVPQLLKGVAGERALNQVDGIHPNEEGHQKMMETVYPQLKKVLTP